eukprot:c20954_g1_i1 orf=312-950(-)
MGEVLPSSALRRSQAAFLFSASPEVVVDFAKIAINVIVSGEITGKGYKSAANKLQVTAEAVEHAVLMLCDIFTRAGRSNLSAQATLTLLEDVGFEEGAGMEALVDFFQENLTKIRDAIINSSLKLPTYEKLEWRLDVQVASRSLRNQATPSFLLHLLTRSNNVDPSDDKEKDMNSSLMEADYKTLKEVCAILEQAVAASSSMHCRRIVRHFK